MQRVPMPAIVPGRTAVVVVAAVMPLLLLAMMPVTEAAPLEAEHLRSLTTQGAQTKPPDPSSARPDQIITEPALDQTPASQTATISDVPLAVVSQTDIAQPNKHPKRDPMTARPESPDKAWMSPGYPETTRRIKVFPMSAVPGAAGKTISSTSDFFSSLKTEDQVTNEPGTVDGASTENSSLDKHPGTSVTMTALVGPGQVVGGGSGSGSAAGDRQARGRTGAGGSDPDAGRREKMLKMLSLLEEIHRAFNGTLSSRLTLMPRGNGHSSGKKSKMATAEGAVKTTAAPSTDNSGTAARTSTIQVDPQSLSGKAFKKSLPPSPKKNNKRVCFWKYCSQN
ncbi:hypothetical protein ACEWY4_001970 [Coilia grayii]|uniref:Urotensin II-related peptide n=1 Tax=Coilia grayii TaxID=363190 RepID=A0ABD1KUF8_9TELE